MKTNPFTQRLTLITGPEAAADLEQSHVALVGLGGVGSWCAEALVRSGIGKITLIDSDRVSAGNVNRQVEATSATIGRLKTEALEERLKEINPLCEITSFPRVFSGDTAGLFGFDRADYVIDAIDSLACKLDLIEAAHAAGKIIFSSMGMAQKLDPTLIKTADIWKTSGCPLARLVRQGLRKRKVDCHFTAVYSSERLPLRNYPQDDESAAEEAAGVSATWDSRKKVINGSSVTVTAAAGMVLASLVILDVYNHYASDAGGGRHG